MVSQAPDIREEVRSYIEAELHGLTVSHLERVAVEHVAGQRYEIGDVHVGQRDRWWVVTNPMFLYSQKDLRSQDVALTFHIGLALRVMARTQPPIDPTAREISSLSGGGESRQRRLLHLLRKPRIFRRSVPIYASLSSRSRTKLQRICTTGSIGKETRTDQSRATLSRGRSCSSTP
jgi:hypothetical protein